MSKATAEWTGTIYFGNKIQTFRLACDAFSMERRSALPLPVINIHLLCKTEVGTESSLPNGESSKEIEVKEIEEKQGSQEEVVVTPVRRSDYCGRCQKMLLPEEVGKGIKIGDKLVALTSSDLASLEFEKQTVVPIERLVTLTDGAVRAMGFRRRLYLFPRPGYEHAWEALYRFLRDNSRMAMIKPTLKKELVIGLVEAVFFDRRIFGEDRRTLVLNILTDAGLIKDPADFKQYGGHQPAPGTKVLESYTDGLLAIPSSASLTPQECNSPKRNAFERLVEAKSVAEGETK